MEIKIDKKHTTVAMFGKVSEIVKKFRKNKAVLDDMETCVSGIETIYGCSVYGTRVSLESIELFAVTDMIQFCLKAEVCGWCHHEGKVRDFIAKLRIYGEITDNGDYFMWSKSEENGAPAQFAEEFYIKL